MMDECPECGWRKEGVAETTTDPLISEGFRAGRKGEECIVPEHLRDMSSKQGDWKHGWRQGRAVFEQMREEGQ